MSKEFCTEKTQRYYIVPRNFIDKTVFKMVRHWGLPSWLFYSVLCDLEKSPLSALIFSTVKGGYNSSPNYCICLQGGPKGTLGALHTNGVPPGTWGPPAPVSFLYASSWAWCVYSGNVCSAAVTFQQRSHGEAVLAQRNILLIVDL